MPKKTHQLGLLVYTKAQEAGLSCLLGIRPSGHVHELQYHVMNRLWVLHEATQTHLSLSTLGPQRTCI